MANMYGFCLNIDAFGLFIKAGKQGLCAFFLKAERKQGFVLINL
jgi:hypothetical protein